MEKIKFFILGLIASAILFGSGVYAATTYAIHSENVEYQDNSGLGVTNVQAAIDGTCTKFNEKLDELRESMYPIGSIYLSTSLSTTTAVATALGGTWEVYGSGRTLIGSDESSYKVGDTGGSTSVSTTLTEENLPAHTHTINHTHTTSSVALSNLTVSKTSLIGRIGMHGATTATNIHGVTGIFSAEVTANSYGTFANNPIANASSIGQILLDASHSHTVTGTVPSLSTSSQSTTISGTTGNGTAFTTSTMQPYIVVYMYRRIS